MRLCVNFDLADVDVAVLMRGRIVEIVHEAQLNSRVPRIGVDREIELLVRRRIHHDFTHRYPIDADLDSRPFASALVAVGEDRDCLAA